MSAGKGDRPRPVNKAQYDANYQRIDWSKGRRRDDGKADRRQAAGRTGAA